MLLTVILAASACQGGSDDGKSSNKQGLDLTGGLQKPKVDGSALKVYSISVAKVKKGDLIIGSLSYEADGGADLVEYRACHEQGDCFQGKAAVNRVEMPAFVGGTITITAHACVDPGRSTTAKNCGPDNTGEFIQPANADSVQRELSSQRAQKLEQLRSMGEQVKVILEKYQKDSEECIRLGQDADKVQAKRQMVGAFVAIGQSLIGTAMAAYSKSTSGTSSTATAAAAAAAAGKSVVTEDGTRYTSNDIKTANKELSPDFIGPAQEKSLEAEDAGLVSRADLSKNVQQASTGAQALSSFNGYEAVGEKALTSVGLYQKSPISGIQSFAASIFDIFHAGELRNSPCQAEQIGQSEMESLKKQMENLQADIAALDSKIAPVNGVVLP
jgi:hypothetical protein